MIICLVLQNTWLSGGKIVKIISYSKANTTREEIIAAAKAEYFIRTMPKGFDTVLDNETSN